MFIGLWNFCDCQGVHPANVMRVKMQVFPGDAFTLDDVRGWVDELLTQGLLHRFEADDGKAYWYVTGWKHQKISHPRHKYPAPKFHVEHGECSPNVGDGNAEDSGTGVGGCEDVPEHSTNVPKKSGTFSPDIDIDIDLLPSSDEEGCQHRAADVDPPADKMGRQEGKSPPPCPQDEIVAAYHELLPMLQRMQVWNDKRKAMLRARWREDPNRQSLHWWRNLFEYIRDQCPFLVGGVQPKDGGRPFMADLEWIIRPSNLPNIIEGKYEDREAA